MIKKLLIATTNEGKFKEMSHELADTPFKIISIKDLDKKIPEPIENQPTIEGNAELKARYYSRKTGLPTLADDTGLFIKALKDWPGVKCARIADNDEDRNRLVQEKLKGRSRRQAVFKTAACFFEPKENICFTAIGQTEGIIIDRPRVKSGCLTWGYNPFFYVPTAKKTYAQMSVSEKNLLSHRGKATTKIKFFLGKYYRFRQLIAPVAVIVRQGKILMIKRRDSRSEYNDKWEFPGGLIDNGETVIQSLKREVLEETNLKIKILEPWPNILSETRSSYNYQVFLLPFIAQSLTGTVKISENENSEARWFSLKQAQKMPLLSLNRQMMKDKQSIELLKKYLTS